MKRLVLSAALIMISSLCAHADVTKGLEAIKARDFETARKEMMEPAKAGDALAQFHMGAMYQAGLGGDRSEQNALRMFRASAEKGNRDAQFSMGYFYQKGKAFLEKNPDMAVDWYTKAAAQGSIAAQYNLGMMYATGEAVPVEYGSNPDYIKSRGWFLIVKDHVDTDQDREKINTQIADLEKHMTPRQMEKSVEFHKNWMSQNPKKQ